MQVIGNLTWVEWLEEGLDDVTEADDEDVELVNGLRGEGMLRPIIIYIILTLLSITIKTDLQVIIIARLVKRIIACVVRCSVVLFVKVFALSEHTLF